MGISMFTPFNPGARFRRMNPKSMGAAEAVFDK
jgi:hypothetical protein